VKVPVLLVVCKASLFLYMYVFIDAALRAKGPRVMVKPPELQRALEGLLNLWKSADHQLKRIRFDREGALTSAEITNWFAGIGTELVPTAAGQKLGLGEVIGRNVKNRAKSVVACIRE
jgi:hypothetical protein